MPGWRASALAWLFAAVLTGGAWAGDAVDVGRRIYNSGIGRDPIQARLGAMNVGIDARSFACARCHGSTGRGGSEGGVTASPLTRAAGLDRDQAQVWLVAALRDGQGFDGHSLQAAMPRFALSERDFAALADYVRTLPYPVVPGLTATNVRIGVAVDLPGSSAVDRAHLLAALRRVTVAANASGGIFGRELEIAPLASEGVARDVFATLSWSSLSETDRPALSIRTGDAPAQACAPCCPTVQPDLESQITVLTKKATTDGRSARIVHDAQARSSELASIAGLQSDLPVISLAEWKPSNGSDAIVYLGAPDGLLSLIPIAGRADIYASMDLVGSPAPLENVTFHLATPVDLPQQIARVRDLQTSEPEFASGDPHFASMAVSMLGGLRHIAAALRANGRLVSEQKFCIALEESVQRDQRISLIQRRSNDINVHVVPIFE